MNKKIVAMIFSLIAIVLAVGSAASDTTGLGKKLDMFLNFSEPSAGGQKAGEQNTGGQKPGVSAAKGGKTAEKNVKMMTLNFKDVPIADAITALSRQAGANITLDKDVDLESRVTSVYSGASVEGALKDIVNSMDLTYLKTPDGYIVTPWQEATIDIHKVYQYNSANMQMQSTTAHAVQPPAAATTGSSQILAPQSSQSAISGGNTGQAVISDFGGYMDSVVAMLKPLLSKDGVVTYMPSGFLYVKDRPSKVKAVEDILSTDSGRRDEVETKVTIVRIDYNEKYESGIDWNKVFQGFKVGSPSQYTVGASFLSDLASQKDNVFTFGYKNPVSDMAVLIKALSTYGNIKVVHSWNTKALTGSVIPFNLTQTAWYSLGNTVQVVNNQTITSPQVSSSNVGLNILLNPIKNKDGYLVNTSVTMSSVIGSQSVGDLTLPNIESNNVVVPIQMRSGEQAVLSGFKVDNKNKSRTGVPILSKLPILEYLFGYTTAEHRTSEIAVIIEIDRIKGQGGGKK